MDLTVYLYELESIPSIKILLRWPPNKSDLVEFNSEIEKIRFIWELSQQFLTIYDAIVTNQSKLIGFVWICIDLFPI